LFAEGAQFLSKPYTQNQLQDSFAALLVA
jgi:hypothetical protein